MAKEEGQTSRKHTEVGLEFKKGQTNYFLYPYYVPGPDAYLTKVSLLIFIVVL